MSTSKMFTRAPLALVLFVLCWHAVRAEHAGEQAEALQYAGDAWVGTSA